MHTTLSQFNRFFDVQAYYFDRSDVALPGFYKFFKKASQRELNNANFLMSYVNKRGGFVSLRDIEVS